LLAFVSSSFHRRRARDGNGSALAVARGAKMNQLEATDIAKLYERHSRLVRSVVSRFLRNPPDVEETVHDVFVQACQQLSRYDPERGNEAAWLTTIARSRALDRLRSAATRRSTRYAATEEVLRRDGRDPACEAEVAEATARIRTGWQRLSPEVQEILRLTYEEDLPQRTIAEQMCLTLGVVKSRMRQGIMTLRNTLDRASEYVDPARDTPVMTERALTVMFRRSAAATAGSGVLSDTQVLVVDDHVDTRETVGMILQEAGARPLLRSSVAEACATLDHIWPDVLLADISMPIADGYCLIDQVRQRERSTGMMLPAIAFTAKAADSDRTRALLAGYRLRLSKPVQPLAIISAIMRVLEPAESEARHAGVA
jgi:RNA polymerase sigma factor (sigma-70 family)